MHFCHLPSFHNEILDIPLDATNSNCWGKNPKSPNNTPALRTQVKNPHHTVSEGRCGRLQRVKFNPPPPLTHAQFDSCVMIGPSAPKARAWVRRVCAVSVCACVYI